MGVLPRAISHIHLVVAFVILLGALLTACSKAAEKASSSPNNTSEGSPANPATQPPAPRLSAIDISPVNAQIHFETTQQFTATGRYTDGSSQELTSSLTWTTLATGIATVSDAGLASTLAIGGTSVIAASAGGVSGTTLLTIVGKVTPPKTGQSLCYDVTGTATVCANTGQDGETQTGVTWPEPRFNVDGTGSCIIDRLTGLMWTRNANQLANSAVTPSDTGQRTWQQSLDYANNLQLCGYTDWRLPNRREVPS